MCGGGTWTVERLLRSKCERTKSGMAKRSQAKATYGNFREFQANGYVTLLMLLLLTILSGMGMEGYLKANAENQMVRRETQSRQALYAAEGGVEWAKAHLLFNSGLRGGNVSLSTGRVDVVIATTNGGGYKVTSQGRSGLAVRKIQVTLQLVTGKWILKSYQELHT